VRPAGPRRRPLRLGVPLRRQSLTPGRCPLPNPDSRIPVVFRCPFPGLPAWPSGGFPVPRSLFPVARSPACPPLPGLWRFPCSPFPVPCSPFPVPRSLFPALFVDNFSGRHFASPKRAFLPFGKAKTALALAPEGVTPQNVKMGMTKCAPFLPPFDPNLTPF
jgi:hypothetical protein